MRTANDSCCVVLQGKGTAERYCRDKTGWLKIGAKVGVFRTMAEPVLNHLLPALASGDRLGPAVEVEHYEGAYWETLTHSSWSGESPLCEVTQSPAPLRACSWSPHR